MMHVLHCEDLPAIFHQRLDHLPDHRHPSPNTRDTIHDAV